MAEPQVLKRLSGYSNSEIFLMEYEGKPFIRKLGPSKRNLERMRALEKTGIRLPEIFDATDMKIDMEYIQGLDMKSYLLRYPVGDLIEFLLAVLKKVQIGVLKDYTGVYEQKLEYLKGDWEYYSGKLPFTIAELLGQLEGSHYYQSDTYIGDLTMDNILFTGTEFVLLDPVTIEYDSVSFDVAKLNQDLVCGWFLRNDMGHNLETKLQRIAEAIHRESFHYRFQSKTTIMMLLRILPYARKKSKEDEEFLYKRIGELWQQ